MSISSMGALTRWCTLCLLIVNVQSAQARQGKTDPSTSQDQSSGAELYKQHCAVCHGGDLRGGGRTPSPYRTPPDLTTLTRRHGGKFPTAYVANVLRNGVILPEHGPAEMPVWGTEFKATGRLDTTQVTERIVKLTNYIRSFQAK